MRTIETTATVTPEGTITVNVPPDIPPGEHRVVLVVDEEGWPVVETPKSPLELKILRWEGWPSDCRFTREDLYADDRG